MPVHFAIGSFKKASKKMQTAVDSLAVYLISSPNIKSIAVTSHSSMEGKSYVALHIANSISRLGKTVIYIDMNMCSSSLKKQYGINADGVYSGINDFLIGNVPLGEIIGSTDLPNVSMILTTPSNDARLPIIDPEKVRSTIDALSTVFDYIVIDTSSVSDGVDALNAISCCDGTVFVVQEGKVSIDEFEISLKKIKKIGGKILTYVLNQHQNK